MAVTYYDDYKTRKLNEVVLMGSHDAGINQGNDNTKTQRNGLMGQAVDGARFFDVRIGAFNNPSGTVSLRAYHDETKIKVPSFGSKQLKTGQNTSSTQNGMKVHATMLGAKGMGLYTLLNEAVQFLGTAEGMNEFLILKFDKSTNWPQIAAACTGQLGNRIFKPTGNKTNLNEYTLEELKGKVIVLFTKEGCTNCGLNAQQRKAAGILQWQNLYQKDQGTPGDFDDAFVGLQYYGKGGVSRSASGQTGKIQVNAQIQRDLMQGQGAYKTDATGWFGKGSVSGQHGGPNATVDPKVVGLMYWTTTGTSWAGIKKRNKKMWNTANQQLLVDATQLAQQMVPRGLNNQHGAAVKRFMPNIVMVDFVDARKGALVKELNTRDAAAITQVIQQNGDLDS